MGIFDKKPNVNKMKVKRDVEGLIKALQYKESSVRANAVLAFGEIEDERAIKPLIKVLEDKNEDDVIRGNAASAISNQHEKLRLAALEPLADALYDSSTYVRWQGAKALSSMRDLEAIRYLMKGVMDRNQNIRQDILDGSSRGIYGEFFLSTIQKLRPMLGEEPEDCCAIVRLLIPFASSEDKFLEEESKKAMEKSPNYAPAHYLSGFLGLCRASSSYDNESKKRYSDQALKEFKIAAELDPKDPEPYYDASRLPFLSFNERQKYYGQALKLDLYRSKAFGGNHWAFAMEAAKVGARGFCVDAFVRAMVVDPDKYKEGPASVMPTSLPARAWWDTAKDEVRNYQDPEHRERLWQFVLEE